MCVPIVALGMTAMQTAMAGLTVATTAMSVYGQQQSGKAQAEAINEQNQVQADEISKAAGQQMTERARAARRERASMRAAGSEMGVNLDTSGSFVAALQASAFNQYNDAGLITYNEKAQQRARAASAKSSMSNVSIPSTLSGALTIGAAAVGSYQSSAAANKKGTSAGVN